MTPHPSSPPVRLHALTAAALHSFLRERHPKATRPRVADAVEELSEAFTAGRARLPGSYMNQPPIRSAYLAFFHPYQMLRAQAALSEVRARASARSLWPAPAGRPLQVLDVGAGLGAMSQALLETLAPGMADDAPWPDLVLVDHQRAALRDARDLTTRVAAGLRPDATPPRIRTAAEKFHPWLAKARSNGWRYDVILCGALLNEQTRPWTPIVRSLLDVAHDDGLVVLVEPALPKVARELMATHDELVGDVSTLAPCTHDRPCPLMERSRDWCFTVRRAELPERVAALAEELHHQTREVRYATWAFTRARPETAAAAAHPPGFARIVSDPMKGEHLLCGDEGQTVRVRSIRGALRGDVIGRAGSRSSTSG